MNKRIVVVNAGSEKGWNTDTLINEAIKGEESAGTDFRRNERAIRNRTSQPEQSSRILADRYCA